MKECVVWTVNLDSKKSRAEGRRIPRRFAVPNVRLQELVEACKELGLNFRLRRRSTPNHGGKRAGESLLRRGEARRSS